MRNSYASNLFYLPITIFLIQGHLTFSQTFHVSGNVSTDASPVRYASITFTSEEDPSQNFSAVTDTNGNYQVDIIVTGVNEEISVPQSIELAQNYPNPFSSETEIPYKLNKQSDVSIKIYDILGRVVKTYQLGVQSNGIYGVRWDGINNFGNRVSPGIYLYQLHTKSELQAKKMIFGIDGTNVNLSLSKIFLSQSFESKKEASISFQGGTYAVEIKNTSITRPKISFTRYSNIVIEQDTTISYNVQLEIMNYSLCYLRVDTLHYPDIENYLLWTLRLNNNEGTKPKTVFKKPRDSYEPHWSYDGKYLAFTHSDSAWKDRDIYLYDTANDSIINFLTSDTSNTIFITWSHDSQRLIFSNQIGIGEKVYYIINVDGKNCSPLKYPVAYLYPDDYNYLYTTQSSTKGPSVYHSNLDGTVNEFIVDLAEFVTIKSGSVTIFDFNSNANDLLLSFDDPSTAFPNMIGKYNITQGQLDTIIVSDFGWKCYSPKFSNDFNKIAIGEVYIADSINLINRISILELKNNNKTTVVEMPAIGETGKYQFIDFNLMAFSQDDKFLAYSKNIVQNKPYEMVWWISYLHIVELDTKNITYIDTGISPKWNPKKAH